MTHTELLQKWGRQHDEFHTRYVNLGLVAPSSPDRRLLRALEAASEEFLIDLAQLDPS